ncbi:hypothetical protein OAE61_04165 [Verrucomicrobiales bacterium]|nr:hypothetical protein [Verrucomicrobiales bacterium]MDB4662809.1 hypothetical protein [Verrucomicrobiales bacterium]MDC0311849.1 hypothetical protein [bacterium]
MSENSTQPGDLAPMSNPVNDIRKLKRNGKATAAELTSFLAQMRGKSPREVLGSVASSNLMRSFVQASIGVAVLVLVLTVIPWLSGMGEKKEAVVAEIAEPAQRTALAPAVVEPSGKTPVADPEAIDIDGKKAAADQMGVTEEKLAPPNVNPLDGSNDDLLKGLE